MMTTEFDELPLQVANIAILTGKTYDRESFVNDFSKDYDVDTIKEAWQLYEDVSRAWSQVVEIYGYDH